jgi:hypothetical protein
MIFLGPFPSLVSPFLDILGIGDVVLSGFLAMKSTIDG